MTTTEKQLDAAVAAIQGTLTHHQCIFTNGQALDARAELARLEFMNRIMSTSGAGTPLNINRGHPEIEVILGLESSARYLAARGIADAVVTSPEFLEAKVILAPLIDAVRKLEAQLASENEAIAAAAAARHSAIEKATAEALAEVEARFSTIEPATQAEPAKPFRGKVQLEETALV